MQSEPSTVSRNADPDSTSDQASKSDQHGLLAQDAETVSLSSASNNAESGTTTASAEQIAMDAAFAALLQEQLGDARAEAARRLNTQSTTPSPPPGYNRITEYEKASTPPVKKRDGPGFEVIKKYRSPNDKRSPIQEVPNGMSSFRFPKDSIVTNMAQRS